MESTTRLTSPFRLHASSSGDTASGPAASDATSTWHLESERRGVLRALRHWCREHSWKSSSLAKSRAMFEWSELGRAWRHLLVAITARNAVTPDLRLRYGLRRLQRICLAEMEFKAVASFTAQLDRRRADDRSTYYRLRRGLEALLQWVAYRRIWARHAAMVVSAHAQCEGRRRVAGAVAALARLRSSSAWRGAERRSQSHALRSAWTRWKIWRARRLAVCSAKVRQHRALRVWIEWWWHLLLRRRLRLDHSMATAQNWFRRLWWRWTTVAARSRAAAAASTALGLVTMRRAWERFRRSVHDWSVLSRMVQSQLSATAKAPRQRAWVRWRERTCVAVEHSSRVLERLAASRALRLGRAFAAWAHRCVERQWAQVAVTAASTVWAFAAARRSWRVWSRRVYGWSQGVHARLTGEQVRSRASITCWRRETSRRREADIGFAIARSLRMSGSLDLWHRAVTALLRERALASLVALCRQGRAFVALRNALASSALLAAAAAGMLGGHAWTLRRAMRMWARRWGHSSVTHAGALGQQATATTDADAASNNPAGTAADTAADTADAAVRWRARVRTAPRFPLDISSSEPHGPQRPRRPQRPPLAIAFRKLQRAWQAAGAASGAPILQMSSVAPLNASGGALSPVRTDPVLDAWAPALERHHALLAQRRAILRWRERWVAPKRRELVLLAAGARADGRALVVAWAAFARRGECSRHRDAVAKLVGLRRLAAALRRWTRCWWLSHQLPRRHARRKTLERHARAWWCVALRSLQREGAMLVAAAGWQVVTAKTRALEALRRHRHRRQVSWVATREYAALLRAASLSEAAERWARQWRRARFLSRAGTRLVIGAAFASLRSHGAHSRSRSRRGLADASRAARLRRCWRAWSSAHKSLVSSGATRYERLLSRWAPRTRLRASPTRARVRRISRQRV